MYTLTAVLDPGATSSCGDDNSVTLFSTDFFAADDEAAMRRANEIIQDESTTTLKDLRGKYIEVTLTVKREVRRFHYMPPQEAQPAREALPAQPARLV